MFKAVIFTNGKGYALCTYFIHWVSGFFFHFRWYPIWVKTSFTDITENKVTLNITWFTVKWLLPSRLCVLYCCCAVTIFKFMCPLPGHLQRRWPRQAFDGRQGFVGEARHCRVWCDTACWTLQATHRAERQVCRHGGREGYGNNQHSAETGLRALLF